MRTISEKGLSLIKEFEVLRLKSYLCSAKVWTIGYGHTRTAKPGMTITEETANQLLKSDVARFERAVNAIKLPLNQNQFDALVSFAFNAGEGNLSTLIRNRNHQQIADALMLYTKAGGKELAGLVRRRASERTLFLTVQND